MVAVSYGGAYGTRVHIYPQKVATVYRFSGTMSRKMAEKWLPAASFGRQAAPRRTVPTLELAGHAWRTLALELGRAQGQPERGTKQRPAKPAGRELKPQLPQGLTS
jgi:hypothetical protein